MRDVIRLKRKSVVATSFEDWIRSAAELFLWLFWSQNEKKKKEKKLKLTVSETGHDDIPCPLHKVNKLLKTELVNSIVLSGLT